MEPLPVEVAAGDMLAQWRKMAEETWKDLEDILSSGKNVGIS